MADNPATIRANIQKMLDQGAPEADISTYLAAQGISAQQLTADKAVVGKPPLSPSERGLDLAKGAGVGLAEAGIGAVGLPGDVAGLIQQGGDYLVGGYRPTNTPTIPPPAVLPTSQNVKQAVEQWTGPFYEPQTPEGQGARALTQFAGGAAIPGGPFRKIVGGVVAPALGSEMAARPFEGGPFETPARVAGGLFGAGLGSAGVSAGNAARITTPGMSRGSGRVLEKTLGPGAEARLAELGPDAFLLEATPDAFGVAQTVATRPGSGRGQLVDAVTARQGGANARLNTDLNRELGPAEVPSVVERALADQRRIVGQDYPAATFGQQRLDASPIVKRLNVEIEAEAGAPKKTLVEIKSYLYGQKDVTNPTTGEITRASRLKTSADELLNVRQAIDDLISRTTEPNAMRLAVKYRHEVDKLMPQSVKAVDARFEELAKQSEALTRGGTVLNTGKEAIRPIELAQDMATMTPGQKSLLRTGTRADLDQKVGTKANDVTALRLAVQSEGDWNRTKLAYVFGQDAADRIMKSVDREAAFQNAYIKLVENSQTAQRLAGAKLVESADTRAPAKTDLTVMGAFAGMGQGAYRALVDSVRGANRGIQDNELARLLTRQGADRDQVLAAIRGTQQRRAPTSTTARDEILRALFAAEAATIEARQ